MWIWIKPLIASTYLPDPLVTIKIELDLRRQGHEYLAINAVITLKKITYLIYLWLLYELEILVIYG